MYNILAIDDEKAILDIIKIVLSDILMPGLDGRNVVDHIRNSDRPCTPIIGISGTPWYLENIQFDAIFTKPFPFEDLINSTLHLSKQVGYDCKLT